ncbi:MAG: tetratricopeptide repeat protein [Pirellulales bacterium]
MTASLERARLLLEHERYDQADREIRGYLAEYANDVAGHYLLAICLSALERYDEATAEARTAIHLAPDQPLSHYALAKVMLARDRYKEAEAAIAEAIRLDPYDADNRALQAAVRHSLRDWPGALAAAEGGLEIDPEHAACLNLRAMSLVQLGRRGEAGQSLAASLAKNPHNAVTHANQGWTLLHERRPKEAMEHFREALRLDPDSEWAKAGILEAIKARNVAYRWLLAYFLWMGRLSSRAQWAVIIGAYVGNRLVRTAARNNPEWAPFLWPLLGIYIAFVVMTWLAYPLFNLMLRLHPLGKHALTPDQRMGANCVGGCLALAVGFAIVSVVADWGWAIIASVVFAALMLPTAGTFQCSRGTPRNTMAAITLTLAALGIATTVLSIGSPDVAGTVGVVFIFGIMASAWIANFLGMRQ